MNDHLEPVAGYFFSSNSSHEYHARVRQTLLAGFDATVLASLVVLPSFAPESILVIGRDGRRYYAVYRVGRSSIGQALRDPLAGPLLFQTTNAELPPALAQALLAVIEAALSQTRYPGQPALILDGTAYYFSAGYRAGTVRSPDPASPLGALVVLAGCLMQQLADPAAAGAVWDDLTEAATSLLVQLRPV